ncbi:MAG TPA: hypothetical protein VJJ55_02120 [Candidatus Paceibacterota bacterium]
MKKYTYSGGDPNFFTEKRSSERRRAIRRPERRWWRVNPRRKAMW